VTINIASIGDSPRYDDLW